MIVEIAAALRKRGRQPSLMILPTRFIFLGTLLACAQILLQRADAEFDQIARLAEEKQLTLAARRHNEKIASSTDMCTQINFFTIYLRIYYIHIYIYLERTKLELDPIEGIFDDIGCKLGGTITMSNYELFCIPFVDLCKSSASLCLAKHKGKSPFPWTRSVFSYETIKLH